MKFWTILLIFVVASTIFLGCSSKKSDENEIKSTIHQFNTAFSTCNIEGVLRLLEPGTEIYATYSGFDIQNFKCEPMLSKITIRDIKISGQDAEVSTNFEIANDSVTILFKLHKTDNWKIVDIHP